MQLKNILVSALFICAILPAQAVYWEPEIPVPGGNITIYYNTLEGTLPDNTSPVYIHLGYNGWQETDDYAMTFEPALGNGWWSYNYTVPEIAETVDFVFTDLDGNWDNNGGIGVDWHISLNYYWTPFNPGANDIATIVLNNVQQGGHIAWKVDAGAGYLLPIESYRPAGSFEEDGWLMSPLQLNRDTYQLQLGPFNLGEQVVQSIKFRIKWDDGNWDTGDNGQIINYDIYFDYTPQDGDPYVFYISPAEGAEISGDVELSVVGDAVEVAYYVQGDFAGDAFSSPFSVTWTPPETLFGDVTIVARALGSNDRVTFLFRHIYLSFSIIHEPVPEGTDDGLTVTGNDILITLYAPAKDYVTVLGSWNQNNPAGELMKLSGDTLWWYQTTLPDGNYTYQFNVEGLRRIADPWSKDVQWTDPAGGWESGYYEDALTNFAVGAGEYNWNDAQFTRPEQRDVVVYETHVGDFKGVPGEIGNYQDIIDKLDEGYFDDLGITALELMPVNEFEGANSWGYNPSFYMAPESAYGTPDELRQLVDTAHQHQIAVLLDVVFNHMWGSAPLFLLYQPVGSWDYQDHDYINDPYFHDQESPWGYKLQHWSPRTRKYCDDALMTWVQEYHFDGFRFDHTAGIGWDSEGNWGATHYGNMLNAYDSTLIIIAEEDNSWQINHTDFDAGWDYSYFHMLNSNLLEINDSGHSWGDMYDLGNHLSASSQGYWDYTGPLNYFESHDEGRIIYEATHYQGMTLETALAKSELGAKILFTSQGTPMLYHGQEFGQNGTSHSGGNIIPQPLQWYLLNNQSGAELFDVYARLIALRRNYEVLRSSALEIKSQSSTNKTIVYWRMSSPEEVIVAANFGDSSNNVDIEFPHPGTWYDYLNGGEHLVEGNWLYNFDIPPGSAFIFLNEIPDFSNITPGDVNLDGLVDILDIVTIVDFIINGPMPSGDIFSAADLNGDNAIDIIDIVMLVAQIIG